jgi:hypothetical protein
VSDSLPSPQQLRETLLDDLVHEDDVWLWEIVWKLNNDCPEPPAAAKIDLARRVVFTLVTEQAIELWRADRWPPTAFHQLDPQEISQLRDGDAPWSDPARSGRQLIQIRATTSHSPRHKDLDDL